MTFFGKLTIFFFSLCYLCDNFSFWKLTYGANLRGQNDEGDTAVHIAAREGRDEALKHLLQRGATKLLIPFFRIPMTTLAPLYENPERTLRQKVGERLFRIKKIGKWDDGSFRL